MLGTLSKRHLCLSFDYGKFDHNRTSSSGFTIVGEPVNVETTVALLLRQKSLVDLETLRKWALFRDHLVSQGKFSEHSVRQRRIYGNFREQFLPPVIGELQRVIEERHQLNWREDDMAPLAAIHKAAIDRYVRDHIIPPPPKVDPVPTSEDYKLAEMMGRETGERLGLAPLQDS